MHSFLLIGLLLGPPDAFGSTPSEPRIANGVDAQTCQWPSVVAMVDVDQGFIPFCSGTLLTPEIVMFAAHCTEQSGWQADAIGFGEDGYNAERLIATAECETHPAYDPGSQFLDLAYCRLAEPVTDIPIIPMLMGCEVGVLDPGDSVAIVGFGAAAGLYDGNDLDIQGGGPKRFTKMTVEAVDFAANDLLILGDDTGACFGDSGGPAFVQLPNGEWRVIGAASTLHPNTPYLPGDNVCTYGTVYELGFTEAGWIEGTSGVDITPCHDSNGDWNPGPDCRDFALQPWLGDGTWNAGCPNGGTTGWVSTCGPPFMDEPEPPIPPDLPPPMEPDPVPPPMEPDAIPPDPEDTGGTGEDPGADDDSTPPGRGCGCTADTRGARGLPLGLLLVPVLWRRKLRRRW